MVAILKALCLFLVLVRVNGQCALSNLDVNQYNTGRQEKGYSIFFVSIINKCPQLCVQSNVKLNCTGFQTAKSISPTILSVSGDVCLVKSGQPITPDAAVNFQYAWSNEFPLNPISSDVHCA
ncbi:uncharacterized protein At1g05835-like [Abrus precatorius]|uniref:Uncharacterized protein At1g05835-like n=1 Tax=Abrus precatorius TaxID=3816 RepID=A0A8B8MBX1_ABRPR|nr:uncharacterized protein At1g05835-like [Abrus precatorius]